MKRFYSLLALMIMVVMTASAQKVATSESTAKQVEGTLTYLGKANHVSKTVKVKGMNPQTENLQKQVAKVKQSPAKEASESWTSLGMGKFNDTFFSNSTVKVEFEQNDGDQSLYRLVNPYAEITGGYEDDPYLYLQIKNAGDEITTGEPLTQDGLVLFYGTSSYGSFNTGYYHNTYNDYICICHPCIFTSTANEDTYAYSHITEYYDDASPKVIKLSPFYYMFSAGGWNNTTNEQIEITMPDPEGRDYDISVSSINTCMVDGKFQFAVEAGKDVATLKAAYFAGGLQAASAAAKYDDIAAEGDVLSEGAGEYSIAIGAEERGVYSVVVVALDADGNVVGGDFQWAYLEVDDAENWTSLGTTTFTEGYVSAYYGMDATSHEVEIEENNTTQGYYRIKNPYAEWAYAQYNSHNNDHNHYIYIHAENPELIYTGLSCIGVDMGDGAMLINSLPNNFGDSYKTSQYSGTIDGNVLTMPIGSLVCYEPNYNKGTWSIVSKGTFSVVLPNVKVTHEKEIVIDFTTQGYENSEVVEGITQDGIQVTFNKGTSNNATAWYKSGDAVRFYYKNVMNIQAVNPAYTSIKNIEFTGATGSYVINAEWSTGEYTGTTWTGDALDITATENGTSGHARIKTMTLTVEYDANMAAAYADMERLEALVADLTEFIKGKDEYITPDIRSSIETFMGDTYPIMIQAALDEANENGSDYVSPINWEQLEGIVAELKAHIEGVMNGTIALYTENGVVGSGADIDTNMPFHNTAVGVDVYVDKVVLKSWDGTEGSNLNVYYTSIMTANDGEDVERQLSISGIEQTVNGEVVSEVDEIGDGETIVRLYPQSVVYPMAAVVVANEMTGIMLGEGAGAISLYGLWQPASNLDEEDNMGVAEPIEAAYMVTWPGEPVNSSITLEELAATPATGEGTEVKVYLDGAKVTAAFDMEDYLVAYVEDETAAIQVAAAEIEAGKALTGLVNGIWADYGTGTGPVLMIMENNAEAVDADVTTGMEITESNELLQAYNTNRLVTVYDSKMCPINVDEDGVVIGSVDEPAAIVYDMFYSLPEGYEYPSEIVSITGILIDMMGMKVLMPRSADDIVAATPADEPLYTTANGKVCKNAEWEAYNYTFLAEERDGVAVEVYDGHIIVRDFEGAEGYDLKMALDAEGNATEIMIIDPDGLESDPTTDYAWGGKNWWYAYLDYSYAYSDLETESGYLIVCAYDYTNNKWGYYNIEWTKDPSTSINNATENATSNGAIYNIAGQKVNKAVKGLYIINGKKVVVK